MYKQIDISCRPFIHFDNQDINEYFTITYEISDYDPEIHRKPVYQWIVKDEITTDNVLFSFDVDVAIEFVLEEYEKVLLRNQVESIYQKLDGVNPYNINQLRGA